MKNSPSRIVIDPNLKKSAGRSFGLRVLAIALVSAGLCLAVPFVRDNWENLLFTDLSLVFLCMVQYTFDIRLTPPAINLEGLEAEADERERHEKQRAGFIAYKLMAQVWFLGWWLNSGWTVGLVSPYWIGWWSGVETGMTGLIAIGACMYAYRLHKAGISIWSQWFPPLRLPVR